MKSIIVILVGVGVLFLKPILCCLQAIVGLALSVVTMCGLFALTVFLIDQKMTALQCVGDCVAWAFMLISVRMAAMYLMKAFSRKAIQQ